MRACIGEDKTETKQAFCQCSLEQVQATYTLREFIQLDRAIAAGEPTPERFKEIIHTCTKP